MINFLHEHNATEIEEWDQKNTFDQNQILHFIAFKLKGKEFLFSMNKSRGYVLTKGAIYTLYIGRDLSKLQERLLNETRD